MARIGNVAARFLMAAVALGVAACSGGRGEGFHDRSGAAMPAGATLAVLPFDNLTDDSHAGLIMADLMAAELYRVTGVRVLEPARSTRVTGAGFESGGQTDNAKARQAALAIGADYVFVGSVIEFGRPEGGSTAPTVAVTVRLLRARDGEVLWSGSISELGGTRFSQESVSDVARRVAVRVVENLPVVAPAVATPAAAPPAMGVSSP